VLSTAFSGSPSDPCEVLTVASCDHQFSNQISDLISLVSGLLFHFYTKMQSGKLLFALIILLGVCYGDDLTVETEYGYIRGE
jgi:hypothetical protein